MSQQIAEREFGIASRRFLDQRLEYLSQQRKVPVDELKEKFKTRFERMQRFLSQVTVEKRRALEASFIAQMDTVVQIFLVELAFELVPATADVMTNPEGVFQELEDRLNLAKNG